MATRAVVPEKVQLLAGVIFRKKAACALAARLLEKRFGAIEYASPVIPFTFTDYYRPQMGSPLSRAFFGFKKLIMQDSLASIKVFTNDLEKTISRRFPDARCPRAINIDPGYITLAKLVLASTKDFSHRIYLRKGIYAEVTLQFRKKGITFLAWTFPDYKSAAYQKILLHMRACYAEKIRLQGARRAA
jgi:hypothetical protein